MTLYFSRLTMKRDPAVNALKLLLDPPDRQGKMDAHHRLLWTLFSQSGNERRDFLWRAEQNGRFYVLSQRQPKANGLFEEPEIKEFEPRLRRGDRLRFLLRANAVRSLPGDAKSEGNFEHKRGRKVDVAMHLLHAIPGGERRAAVRFQMAEEASRQWLERQGMKSGFSVRANRFVLDNYSTVALPGYRGKREREPRFGVFDMQGEIEVTEPEVFLRHLAAGYGRAKAYGCGLMLVRRA